MEIETSFYRASAAADHPAQRIKDSEATMNAKQIVTAGTSVEQQLASIQMPESMRSEALGAACIAQLIVDAFVRVCEKFARASAETAMKSGYYWE